MEVVVALLWGRSGQARDRVPKAAVALLLLAELEDEVTHIRCSSKMPIVKSGDTLSQCLCEELLLVRFRVVRKPRQQHRHVETTTFCLKKFRASHYTLS